MTPLTQCAKALVRFYQISFGMWCGGRCRFVPSCSEYALELLSRHTLSHALFSMIKRVLRCHPFGGCGYDPVTESATRP